MTQTCEQLQITIMNLHNRIAHLVDPEIIDELQHEILALQEQQRKQGCILQFSGNTFVGAGAAASGNMSVAVVVDTDGRIYYSYSVLSGQPSEWIELPGAPATDAPPAVSLVGDNHDYLFVLIKTAGAPGRLVLNQGHLGQGFVGWR
jgi:hypothetical protein